ncbi:hypothetical protein GCM10027275_48830 [Rhabdobacter roseus]|uniref:Putative lipoprotein n=1 Tax=Rhabdobacter roseus TaxID=1655419 RepID=A0A840TZI9_9BACT|nr:imelysin family protein [Rhabdobacter roseus]MBB5286947.1 putative lipoprotein [Rhabdobacter roseus]
MVYRLIFFWLSVLTLTSCSKNVDPEPFSRSDRQRVLNSIGYTNISSGLLEFQITARGFNQYVDAYALDPTSPQKLNALREAWLRMAIAWKEIALFGLGPSAPSYIPTDVYTPINPTALERVISQNGAEIDAAYFETLNPTHKGIVALEYLLFDPTATDLAPIIASFTSPTTGSRRLAYLKLLSAHLQERATTSMYQWSSGGGDAISRFISADGMDQNSSLSLITAQFIRAVTVLKEERLGAPLGANHNGQVQPDLVDAKYSLESVALLQAELKGASKIFYGVPSPSQGGAPGLRDLLDKMAAKTGDQLLGDAINARFQSIDYKIEPIRLPLKHLLVLNPATVNSLYKDLEELETLLKVDMVKYLRLPI